MEISGEIMASTVKPEVTKEELAKAQNCWHGFTKLMTWGTIATIGIVIFLALVTL